MLHHKANQSYYLAMFFLPSMVDQRKVKFFSSIIFPSFFFFFKKKKNNTYHSTIKMKPVDVKLSTYIDSSKEISPYHAKSSNSINFLIFCLP